LRSALAPAEELVRAFCRYSLEKVRYSRKAGMFPVLPQQGQLWPVIRELVDLPVVELDRTDRLRWREERAAFGSEPGIARQRAVLGEPGGNRRAADAVA